MSKKAIVKRAVGYARVSTDMQNESSIDAQIYGIKEYCEKHGYGLVNTYIDFGISGTTDQRPQFLQMIEDSKKGIFEAVMVHKGDRFARSRNLSSKYKEILAKNKIEFISVTECFGSEPESVLLEGLTEAMAEYYSRNLAREVRKGLLQKARDCLYTGGNLPLGYDVDPDTQKFIRAKNEDEIRTVQLIFQMKKENYGYAEIIRALEAKGLNKSKKGNTLSKSAINWMLHNERYTGVYIYDRLSAKGANGRNGHLFKPEEDMIRIEGGIPQIIDKDTFEAVQKIMATNKKTNGRFRLKHPVLLTGLIECECGYSFVSCYRKERPGHKAYSSYHCGYKSSHKDHRCSNKGIEQTSLDDAVLDLLYKYLYDDVETITNELNAHRKAMISNLDSDLQTVKKQITANEIKVKNIVDAIAQGVSNAAMFDRIKELEEERKRLEEKLSEASRVEETVELTTNEVQSILDKSREWVRTKNISEVRRFIDKYIHKVVVFKETVEVTFNVAFSFGARKSANYRLKKILSRDNLSEYQYVIRKAV